MFSPRNSAAPVMTPLRMVNDPLSDSNASRLEVGGNLAMPGSSVSSPSANIPKGSKDLDGALTHSQAREMNFEFTCENKKCRAQMQISGAAFKAAMLEDLTKRKFKGKPKVGVACDKCGHIHNLVAPPGMLDEVIRPNF